MSEIEGDSSDIGKISNWKDEQAPCICPDMAIQFKVFISGGPSSTS
ncbi:hypothetical protein T11_2789 [Trichinella zimbabwensis]|uniref:Uncharacterized protein n=1 Tax=Trichinella zimbabwensis TaxID=268475 RepID=A0A0V1GYG1_9BILA|nr:hypothetical protein T11_2789 [Trichinella zimbabwensis]